MLIFGNTRGKRSPRWKRNRRLKCMCGGYWFPHRKTGGLCYYGARGPWAPQPCPF